ncbi:helix-turn-helix domain-containing protein [Streptomyces xanthochromogenes]|uniref:ArsR/SmtB family transcription factor n=1 Tax=Streptomyces xanthochromogenes TaxID=67384 RepID=UPI00342F4B9D
MSPTNVRSAGRGLPAPGIRALAALLGATRSQVLRQIANRAPATTNEIVAALEVSAATVSHHTGVLSRSGLITTRRDGASVRHTLTSLGRSLLDAHGLPAAPPAPPRP